MSDITHCFQHSEEITTKFSILLSKLIRNWQLRTKHPNGQHTLVNGNIFPTGMGTDHRANALLNIHSHIFTTLIP